MHQPIKFFIRLLCMFFINSTKGLMYTLINHFDSFIVNCISTTFCSLLMHTFNKDKYVFLVRIALLQHETD